MLAGAICIILSLEIVDTDAGVIGVVWIVRTEVLAGAGVEKAFTARTGTGCLLQVFEALGHALLLDNIPLLPRLRSKPTPDFSAHTHIVLGQVFELEAIPIIRASSLH